MHQAWPTQIDHGNDGSQGGACPGRRWQTARSRPPAGADSLSTSPAFGQDHATVVAAAVTVTQEPVGPTLHMLSELRAHVLPSGGALRRGLRVWCPSAACRLFSPGHCESDRMGLVRRRCRAAAESPASRGPRPLVDPVWDAGSVGVTPLDGTRPSRFHGCLGAVLVIIPRGAQDPAHGHSEAPEEVDGQPSGAGQAWIGHANLRNPPVQDLQHPGDMGPRHEIPSVQGGRDRPPES